MGAGRGVLERYIACVSACVRVCARVCVEKLRKSERACERRAKGMNDRGSGEGKKK